MRGFETKYGNRCINHKFYKMLRVREVYWYPLDIGNEPFYAVYLGYLSLFTLTENVIKYVFTIIDGFSMYVVLKTVKDVTASETINHVTGFICDYGEPTVVRQSRWPLSNSFTVIET